MHLPPHRPMIPGVSFPKPYIPPPPKSSLFPPPIMPRPYSYGPTDGLGLVGTLIGLILVAIFYFAVIMPHQREFDRRWQEHKAIIDHDWPADDKPVDKNPGKHWR